ncbi:MAG: hypothetical protein RLN62_00305 [Rickettsiales bacterium]
MLRFWLWWQYFKKFFFEALSKVFAGRPISWYFSAIIQAIGKWYLIMVPPAVYVVYKLYVALEKAGILNELEKIVRSTIYSVTYIADFCFKDILDLKKMMSCIDSAPSSGPFPNPQSSIFSFINDFYNIML